MRSLEGYKLSAPVREKVTHSIFIDDLKGYTMSRTALKFVLKLIWADMRDEGLLWNLKKCRYLEVHRRKPIALSLKEEETYEFLIIRTIHHYKLIYWKRSSKEHMSFDHRTYPLCTKKLLVICLSTVGLSISSGHLSLTLTPWKNMMQQ